MRILFHAAVITFGLAIGSGIGGCAALRPTRYMVNVDSLAQSEAALKKRYVLFSGKEGVDVDDLQFQEFATYVALVLRENGYLYVANLYDADVAIFLSYGIGDPEIHQYSYSTPIWGQTGVAASTTYGTISTPGGGAATYSGNTTYTPTFGITGSQAHAATSTTYARALSLEAYDVPTYLHGKKMLQVWTTRVVSTGSSGDLRLVLPYMVAAMKPYLGISTGQGVQVEVAQNAPYVQWLLSSRVSVASIPSSK